ncbi:hypothetical protein LTR91_025917 [Friedmanniomyces endolithicus]|uniref:ubiquitinyl hydrolase 1 n=1 Tax=Friedmanniomyces endolithicus TaxID=329885 RepID=A0AAN6H1V4_9PEZI|nr:hypothetical protein LTR91_025917 [Friedmanniomyces endolithicus]
MQYAENLQGTPLAPHALHLNDEHKLQAYEYDMGAPRPPLHEDFIRLFREFALQRRLGKRIAIVPNSAITRYAALETLVIDSHGEVSGMRSAPSKHEAFSAVNTNWSFREEQDRKLSASGWDIGKKKALPTTGFSGTNDSRTALPLHVHQLDLPTHLHTNPLVLDYLIRDGNGVESIPAPPSRINVLTSDAERLLDMVFNLDSPARVILYVGAQILELSNVKVAEHWLALSDSSVQAVVFFNQLDELSVINRKGRIEVLQTSAFATQLDVCLVFLDGSHTRGIDLPLPETYRAAVTLGAGLTKDRLTQPSMRTRKLGQGQTLVFCVPAEIEAKILLCTAKC